MAIPCSDPLKPFQPNVEKVWLSILLFPSSKLFSMLSDPYRRQTIDTIEHYYGPAVEYYFHKDRMYLSVVDIEKATEIHNTKNSYIASRQPLDSKLFDKPNLSGNWLVYEKNLNCHRDEVFEYVKKFGQIEMYGYKRTNNLMYIRFKDSTSKINVLKEKKYQLYEMTV